MDLAAIFQQLWNQLKADEKAILLPPLAVAVTAVAANPTIPSLLAQGSKLLATVLAAEVQEGQNIAKDLASILSEIAASEVPPTPAPAAK